MTQDTPATAPRPAPISPWRNAQYPYSLVQAMPEAGDTESKPRLASGRCTRVNAERPCPGTSDAAFGNGVLLLHEEAIHAIHAHYIYANQSLLRFRSTARGDYAADLVFEIDAHGTEPDFPRLIDYARFIQPAVTVARRIAEFLVANMGVAPGWITTSVTRMGVSVCVDWRAFGPRRLWEILAAIRWIENESLKGVDLQALAAPLGAPLKIDTAMYEPSDLARSPGRLGAHWLRPLGALHAKSSLATAYFRKTPVSHDLFRPEHAELLALASRGNTPDPRSWAHPQFFETRTLLAWPEARHPRADKPREGRLPLASGLVDLLESDIVERLSGDTQTEVRAIRDRHLSGGKIRGATVRGDLTDEVIQKVVEALADGVRERAEGFQLTCPRPGCKTQDRKAIVFKGSGVFSCFRCTPGAIPLRELCTELGLLHLLPPARASSSPIQRRLVESIEVVPEVWSDATVIEPAFESLDDARADQRRVIEEFLDDEEARLLVLVARPGVGKTTAVAQVAAERGLALRAFLPRDEAKEAFVELVPNAKVLIGRRLGDNCWNDDLDEVTSRLEPVGETLCLGTCPHKKRCENDGYLSQFAELPHQVPLVLHHAHAVHADLDIFDNASALDFLDEDALDAAAEHVLLSPAEIARLRTRRVIDERALDEDGTFGIGAENTGPPVLRVATNDRWETLITGLERRLSDDAMLGLGADRPSLVTDIQLAEVLFRDRALREAVATLDDGQLDQLRAEMLGLRETTAELRMIATAARKQATEREADHAIFAALSRLGDDREGLERPIDRARELVAGLRQLLFALETRQNCTSSLLAEKADRGRGWVLRLSSLRPLLPGSKKVIHASASVTPERLRLMHVPPTPSARWTIYRPRLPQREHWTLVADRTYGKRALVVGKGAEPLRERLFEVVRKLIDIERSRTHLPVAVIGPSAVVNEFNRSMLGKLTSYQEMPFRENRAARMKDLRSVTEPRGYISGYAYGIAGSNEFSVDVDGRPAFVRALVVLGACIPNLEDYAAHHHGLFAGGETINMVQGDLLDAAIVSPLVVDWSLSYRTIPVPGTEDDGEITVLMNVPGFADPIANAVLAGTFEGELLQIAGRLRSDIADPRDPTLQPRVYQFGAAVVPGVRIGRVMGLDELRAELGLHVEAPQRRGRKPELSIEDRYRQWQRKLGKPAAISRLVVLLHELGSGVPMSEARSLLLELREPWGREEAAIALKVVKLLGKSPPKSL